MGKMLSELKNRTDVNEEDSSVVHQLLQIPQSDASSESVKISFVWEPRLSLWRHQSVMESMFSSPVTMLQWSLWLSSTRTRTQGLLTSCGLSLIEGRRRFSVLPPLLQCRFVEQCYISELRLSSLQARRRFSVQSRQQLSVFDDTDERAVQQLQNPHAEDNGSAFHTYGIMGDMFIPSFVRVRQCSHSLCFSLSHTHTALITEILWWYYTISV